MSDCVVNIVVGRFQSPMLTGDQRDLLDRALQGSDGGVKPVVVMGLSPLRCTASNPLDYESRIAVVEAEYPGKFNFRYIKDQNSDKVWSENFDKLVKETLATSGRSLDVKVLGSKDGFYNHYVGEFKDKFEEFT